MKKSNESFDEKIKRILKDADEVIKSINPKDSTNVSYVEFIKYFERLKKEDLQIHHFIIGAHFTYGWMPTMLDLREITEKHLGVLNKARNEEINSKEFNDLKSIVNNSVVGTSKLLHFINPRKYAIWDSRVCRYCFKSNWIGTTDTYYQYLKFCNYAINSKQIDNMVQKVRKQLGYGVSNLRAIELIMYLADKIAVKNEGKLK